MRQTQHTTDHGNHFGKLRPPTRNGRPHNQQPRNTHEHPHRPTEVTQDLRRKLWYGRGVQAHTYEKSRGIGTRELPKDARERDTTSTRHLVAIHHAGRTMHGGGRLDERRGMELQYAYVGAHQRKSTSDVSAIRTRAGVGTARLTSRTFRIPRHTGIPKHETNQFRKRRQSEPMDQRTTTWELARGNPDIWHKITGAYGDEILRDGNTGTKHEH